MRFFYLLFLCCQFVYAGSGHSQQNDNQYNNYLSGYPAMNKNKTINAVIEIPAGSVDKWEVSKKDGSLNWELVNGKKRKVKYLGYPANYGMIPSTLLPKSIGGDGDPLDVIVLGERIERGSVIPVKLIGVLKLQDRGEHDDKIIAVPIKGDFSEIKSLSELEISYPGVMDIIKTWFINYKGKGKLTSTGYQESKIANSILDASIKAFKVND